MLACLATHDARTSDVTSKGDFCCNLQVHVDWWKTTYWALSIPLGENLVINRIVFAVHVYMYMYIQHPQRPGCDRCSTIDSLSAVLQSNHHQRSLRCLQVCLFFLSVASHPWSISTLSTVYCFHSHPLSICCL